MIEQDIYDALKERVDLIEANFELFSLEEIATIFGVQVTLKQMIPSLAINYKDGVEILINDQLNTSEQRRWLFAGLTLLKSQPKAG